MTKTIKLAFDRFAVKREEPALETVVLPPVAPLGRVPLPGEPLAFCADCRDWTPMEWLSRDVRGKHCDEWFRCADCGGGKLTFRHLLT